jgi:3-oxoacyl-[acyl-carrier-protein] synthase II
MQTFTAETLKLAEGGPKKVSPFFIPMMISNMAAGNLAIRFNAHGPCLPVVTACATSSHAIGEAYRAIQHGYADAIIAGGSEATITPLQLPDLQISWLCQQQIFLRIISPFDKRPRWFVMGEAPELLFLKNTNMHVIAVQKFMPRCVIIPTRVMRII